MACPGDDSLENWLRGTGDESVAAHVEECPACRDRLEALTSAAELAPGLAFMRSSVAVPVMEWSRQAAARAAEARAARQDGPPAQGTLVGNFEIIAELGRGGSGIVYRALDTLLCREVAIKVFLGKDSGRILSEARRLASIGHPAIVPIHSVLDRGDGLPPAIAMELVPGESLAQRIGRGGPLQPVEAAEILARVALGVAAAHDAGLIHRDIKPANILLDPATDRVFVADFGLALDAGSGEGPFGGTPGFMAPERIGAQAPAGAPADIYSLGATLYQALTGELPYRGQARQALDQALAEDPTPVRHLNRSVPRDLETICHKAMARNPSARYPSAKAFADDLARWLSDKPILARPPGPFGRANLWIRRNSRVALFALVVGTLLAALAALSLAFAWKSSLDAAALRAGKARARENLEAALDEIARMIGIAGGEAARWPGASPMRKKLIALAGDTVDRLALANLGEPETAAAAARVAVALAEFLRQTGETARALEILDIVALKGEADPAMARFVRLARLQLAAHHADMAAYDRALAACRQVADAEGPTPLGAQARVLAGSARRRNGQFTEARVEFAAAANILDSLPPKTRDNAILHTLHTELAATAIAAGDLESALTEAREALRHAAASRPETPAEPFSPVEETRARLTLASILLKLGRVPESAIEAKAAEDAISPAVLADPQRLDWRQLQVETLMARGDCLWNLGALDEALALYGPTRAKAEALLAADPDNTPYRMQAIFLGARTAEMRARRMEFAACLGDLGHILSLYDAFKGKIPDSLHEKNRRSLLLDIAVIERLAAVPLEDPSLPRVDDPALGRAIRVARVLSLARMEKWEACARNLAEEMEVPDRNPAELLQLARTCALLARRDNAMATKALDFLGRALAGNPDYRLASISDPEFATLRPLPGFKALVQAQP